MLIGSLANSQVQITADSLQFDLNPGGEVHDVMLSPYGDFYLVVGNFTSFGGLSVNNYALIDAQTFNAVDPSTEPLYDFIHTIDGEIWSVDYYQQSGFPVTFRIFMGGNFSTITKNSTTYLRDGIFEATSEFFAMPTNFTISNWNSGVDITPGFDEGVSCISVIDGILFYGGKFFHNTHPTNGLNFSAVYAATKIFPTGFNMNYLAYNDIVNDITYDGTHMYVSGRQFDIVKFTLSGNPVTSPSFVFDPYDSGVYEIFRTNLFEDTVLVSHLDGTASADTYSMNELNGSEFIQPNPFMNTSGGFFSQSVNTTAYRDQIIDVAVNGLSIRLFEGNGSPSPPWKETFSINYHNTSNINRTGFILTEQNVAFISSPTLTSFDGLPRVGLAAVCLKPNPAGSFTFADSIVCQGDYASFSIQSVPFADGYRWEYSSVGVDLDTSTVGFYETTFFTVNPTLSVEILNSFSSGTLTVTPYSDCNGNTIAQEKIFSESSSLIIDLDNAPNINHIGDTTITCFVDTVNLFAASDTLGTTFSWNQEYNTLFTDSLGSIFSVTDSNFYYISAIGPNGCINRDTINVNLDNETPTINSVENWELGCNDSAYYHGYVSGTTDTLNWWIELATLDSLSNPALIYTSEIGQWRFYSMDTINGCADSVTVNINDKITYPNFQMVGYDSVSASIDLDTLLCSNSPLNLTAYSDTANTIVNWVDNNYENPLGDSFSVTTGGLYYLHALNTDNNCENTIAFNIAQDFSEPLISTGSYGAINCSADSVLLMGSSGTPDTTLIWSGGSIPPSAPPVSIGDAGTYYLTVTKNSNGCSVTDSVIIVQDNSIDLLVSNDTSVCDQYPVNVSASYVGTINNITYLWSNGSTTSSTNYTAGDDSLAIVEVNGDGGCYGTDTVQIQIPPYPVINFQGFQPCGSGSTGSIVATPISGWFPFEYSIDNGLTYQTSNTIGGLDFGTYSIYVKDSLDCEYLFQATIDETSEVATPLFLFSTYNAQADTVRVIDVSSPAPDSVEWVVSPEIIILEANDSSALLHLPDTGEFTITMDAYFGTCLNSLTKTIHVSELDPNDATLFNANGIDTVYADPNPTTGVLNIGVELFSEQDVQIQIVDMSSYIHHEQLFSDTDNIQFSFTFPAAASPGTYIIRVIGEFDAAFKEIILTE